MIALKDVSAKIVTSAMPAELPPMPIEPAWIRSGSPEARGTILTQSEDRLVSSGFWSCTAGKFEWTFAWDEFVHILEGEVIIREIDKDGAEVPGTVNRLQAGSVAHFPRGLRTLWEVPGSVRKFFTLRTVEPL